MSTVQIAVLGRKGGSAKTTTAYNLAGALVALGRRCLLVDLDSQASLTRALSDEPVRSEYGIGSRIADMPRGIRDIIRPVGLMLDLAPGDRSVEATSLALAQNPTGPMRLRLLLDEVRDDYDAIIVDTAPLLRLHANCRHARGGRGRRADADGGPAGYRRAGRHLRDPARIAPLSLCHRGDRIHFALQLPRGRSPTARRAASVDGGIRNADRRTHPPFTAGRASDQRANAGGGEQPALGCRRGLPVARYAHGSHGGRDVSATRKTGPRVAGPALSSTGPRVAMAQPSTPPTNVQLGNDRLLVGAREVDITQLTPDPAQPRRHMHPDRLAELARSIAQYGVLQPLVVRQEGLGRDGDMRYTIVAGGRRYAAVRLAIGSAGSDDERRRLARVPVVVTETKAAEQRVLQLIENLQREDLDPVEEARALKELMRIEKLTTDGVAARVQRSQGYVDERLRLLRYEDVEEAVESGLLTKSAAAAIASIRITDARQAWLERARLGETIRPRDVYASKPDRRANSRARGTAVPNFGNSSPSAVASGDPPPASRNGNGAEGDARPAPAFLYLPSTLPPRPSFVSIRVAPKR